MTTVQEQRVEARKADAVRFSSTYATKRVTATGRVIDFLNPTPNNISIVDIAEALSKQCRFTGHTAMFYSVAQHCCLVHDLCSLEARPWALLHDAHEAYIGDIPSPLKTALHALGGKLALDIIATRFDNAIAGAFKIQWPLSEQVNREINHFDKVALNTERYIMLDQRAAHSTIWAKDLPSPRLGSLRTAWKWDTAFENFMDRFEALGLPRGAGA